MLKRLSKPTFLGLAVATAIAVQTTGASAEEAKSDAPAAPVPPQPSTTTATYGDWVLRCVALAPGAADNAKNKTQETCEVVLTVQIQGQAQPIAKVAIGHRPDVADPVMTAVVPVNISIPGKVHISGNGKSGDEEEGGIDLGWKRCLAGACFAEAVLSDGVLAVMRAKASGYLQLMDAGGREIKLPLSWRGLTQALDALK